MNEGETVSLTCTINKGDVPVTIEWFLNGKPADSVNGIYVNNQRKKVSYLSVDALHAEHAGKYTCRATNWAGSAYYTTVLAINGNLTMNCIGCD